LFLNHLERKKMKKKFKFLLILAFAVSFLCAHEVPKRVVGLDPASIEIIYELGLGDKMVGIATLQQSKIEPVAKTSKLASVGSFSNPSVEKIIALKPDLVILSSYSVGLEPRLKELKIPTMYLKAERLDELFTNIEKLGAMFHKENEAKALSERVQKELDALRADPINKSGIFLFSSNHLMAFSQNSVIADILNLIGVKNLTPQSEIKRPIITSEYILTQNPDLLILSMQAKNVSDLTDKNPILKNTKAYKEKQIFIYDNVYSLLRISPNITKAIKKFKEDLQSKISK